MSSVTGVGPSESVATALGATNTSSSSSTASTDATGSNSFDQQTFLKLLVAQLKYQNPDSPTDPSAFLQQTATFTQVQSLQDMEKSMTSMLAASQQSQAASMLGQTVTWPSTDDKGNSITLSGTVNSVSPNTIGGPTLSVVTDDPTKPVSVALSSVTTISPTPATAAATSGSTDTSTTSGS